MMPNMMLAHHKITGLAQISITPRNESLATLDAIRSMKLGSKRRCFAERTRSANPYEDRAIIIAFPSSTLLPVAANN